MGRARVVNEGRGEIEGLNGRPTSAMRCLTAWKAYKSAPSDAAKEALRIAYEAVPAHNRQYVLGDMDTKDHPIRYVLYPDEYSK